MSYQCTEKEFSVYLPHRYFIPVQSQGRREKLSFLKRLGEFHYTAHRGLKAKDPCLGAEWSILPPAANKQCLMVWWSRFSLYFRFIFA
jgi:hypothetical protein